MSGIADIDLFIIGAPKSGTTSFHRYLAAHPKIAPAYRGESQFLWDGEVPPYPDGTRREAGRVRLPARRPDGCTYLLDKSPFHLYRPEAIPIVKANQPDAKVLILLRDPAELLYSLHGQFLSIKRENEPRFRRIVARCEHAGWSMTGEPAVDAYVRCVQLRDNTKRWVDAFGSNACVISMAALKKDTKAVHEQVLKWLGLEPVALELARHNQGKAPRVAGVEAWLKRPGPVASMVGRAVMPSQETRIAFGQKIRRLNARKSRRPLPTALRTKIERALADEVAFVDGLASWQTEARVLA